MGTDTGCDVVTVEYDAAISGWADQAIPLPAQADQIADLLAASEWLRGRDLVLIGHSMGGLIIKTLLIHGRTKGDRRIADLVQRVKGVVFVATPHSGSQLANIARAVRAVVRTNDHVSNLTLHDQHLHTLNQQFRNIVEETRLSVRAFGEGKRVKLPLLQWLPVLNKSLLVVDPSSSDPGLTGVTIIRMAANHFTICKPADRNDQIHTSVCDFIASFSSQIDGRRASPPGLRSAAWQPSAQNFGPSRSSLLAEPGRLIGGSDNRLQPREGTLYGRDAEVATVLAFLRDSNSTMSISAHVAGIGGIGKTEVCKAALRAWMLEHPDAIAYFVEVPDRANVDEFVFRIAQAVGLEDFDRTEALLSRMPPGLYYLDNLESIAETSEGIQLLRGLSSRPGIRVLASSRVSLSGLLGRPIAVAGLPTGDGLRLFRKLWEGGDMLPPDDELARFVDGQLGCHALSIALSARLGQVYPYTDLVQRWAALGTRTPGSSRDGGRLDSLQASLLLTSEALAVHDGALALWTSVAVFGSAIPNGFLGELETLGGWNHARPSLVRHHLLAHRDERWHMLPPVARYALDLSVRSESGFDWVPCRQALQLMFGRAAGLLSNSDQKEALKARQWWLDNFGAWCRFLWQDLLFATPDIQWIEHMITRTANLYQFRSAMGRDVLQAALPHLSKQALTSKLLGDLESRLGRPGEARQLYDRALALYEGEQAGLGQANTLKSLGDLERRLGRPGEARQLYDRALALYESEQAGLGPANTLQSLGDLESRLGRPGEARQLYDRALALYESEQDGLGQANTLQSLGDLESRLGRPGEARQLYDRALALFEGEQDGLGQANTLKSLGDLESRLGRPGEARQLYDRALALYEGEQDGLGQANTLKSLGDLERRLGRPGEARQLYDRALALYEGEQAGLGQANTLKSLGDLERRLGRPGEARQLYDRALALFEGEQDGLGQANTLKSLGDLERRLGRPGEARQLYDRALALFEGEQDGLGQANTLKSLGDLESRLGRPGEARQLYDRALALYEGEQAGLGQANTLQSLGDLESRLGRPGEARQLYDRALALYESEQDGLGQANTLQSLGDLESRLGRPGEARQLYDRALALFEGEQDGLGQANTLKSLGDLESRLGRPGEARQLYDRALALFEGEQDGLGQANTLKSLGDLERRLGRPGEARQLYDRALALYEGEQAGLGQANTLKSLGDLESRLGRPGEARQLYDRALALYRAAQEPIGTSLTLAELARCFEQLGRTDDRDLVLAEASRAADSLRSKEVIEHVYGIAREILGARETVEAWRRRKNLPPLPQ
ncbi:MAG: tetratricopeptide repeat protein [Reyranellaceae bacterium]